MSHDDEMIYWINRDDELVFVGGGWDRYAEDSGAADLVSHKVVGTYFWDFIHGAPKHLYRQVVKEARKGRTLRIEYRCDTTTQEVYKELLITPMENGFIQFETATIRTSDRKAAEEPLLPEENDVIVACSWCDRIKIGKNEWTVIDHAANILHLFDERPRLTISGGMCDRCYSNITASISEREISVLTGG